MIKQSIRRRIVSIAVGLIVLMVATSVLSMVMVGRVGHLLDELTARYIPANAHLTRITVLSLERAVALRAHRVPGLWLREVSLSRFDANLGRRSLALAALGAVALTARRYWKARRATQPA